MPTTSYDKDAERINRPRGPWWHKWVFVAEALIAAFTVVGLAWLAK